MLEKLDTLIAFAVVMLGISLIITILTQIVSTALGLRGSNLLWGLETLLQNLAPGLAGAGLAPRALAEEILQHPLISDSTFSKAGNMWLVGSLITRLTRVRWIGWVLNRWRYATAIRPEELVRIIQAKISSLPAGHAAIGVLNNMLSAADPESERKLQLLRAAMANIVPAAGAPGAPTFAVQLDRLQQQVTDVAQQTVGKVENWFSSTMDRVSQRFVTQVRIWTVVFAFLLAFGAHLDSLRLLGQLSSNPDTRAALVKMSDSMLKEADAVSPPGGAAPGGTEVPVSTTVLQEALDSLKKSDPTVANVGPIPAGTVKVGDAVKWLSQQPGVSATAPDAYRRIVIDVLRKHAVQINDDLTTAGVQLFPSDYHDVFKYADWKAFVGVLLAAAFLSLGAPFWYNALKNLSNLRTVVASKEKQESAGT